uniref:Neuronal-specific septin-3 n=3 Tax=Gouania willdenowi TaxID=441366 RepID=A0A8C5HDK8_GOUWI
MQSDSSLLLQKQKLRVSSTLIVPLSRPGPSPTILNEKIKPVNQGGNQDRHIKSILISDTIPVSSSEEQKLIPEQDSTHPEMRQFHPKMKLESKHSTYPEFVGMPALSQNPFTKNKPGTSKMQVTTKDKPETPPRNTEIPTFSKRQQGCQSSVAIVSDGSNYAVVDNGESHSVPVVDRMLSQRRRTEHSQRSNVAQTTDCSSIRQLYEQTYSEKRDIYSESPKGPFSSEPLWSHSVVSRNIETRQNQFGLHNKAREDKRYFTGCHFENKMQSLQESLSIKTQSAHKDPRTVFIQSGAKDYNCHSKDFDPKTEASLCALRLCRLKACLAEPQTEPTSNPTSMKSTALPARNHSKPDLQLKESHSKQEKSLEQKKKLKGVNVTDTAVYQTEHSVKPDHHRVPIDLPGHLSENLTHRVPHGQFATSGPKQLWDPTSQQAPCSHQRAETTTHLLNDVINRVNISEDPHYVTMYCPGSVYVDMSDVVPPEVRPKPAVPAKPPNVGAPSPSSSFPPQIPGLGVGSGPAPPSAIPVPIGSHGPSHGASHVLGHAPGHAVGHVPQSGGHGHGGSHSSSGGSTLLGYIGIDTIIEQMRKKTMKTGFEFNIMVVGHSGLGKSTLVNTLFKSQVSRKSAGWARDEKIPKTVEIKSVSHVIEEGGVKMKLTVVDTPGFGDQINNDNCWEPISKYINEQFEKFLKEEVNITRKKRIPDTRVHCCIYFISPTGHTLRQLDMEFMKRLSHSVNIIPVIAKADTMTIEERQEFKQRVRKELEMSGIEFYPQKEFDDDMEDKSDNDKIRETMPFAVVGSDKEYQVNNKRVLGRKTAWGIVEVENPNHCEFAQLRDFLIRSHLQDLKEVTHNIHYETYRAKRLNDNGGLHPISTNGTHDSNL